MRIVFLSDTHSRHRRLDIPDGDVLIHAGDFTNSGTVTEAISFMSWFESLPHLYKIIVCGNHDLCMNPKLKMGSEFLRKMIERYLSLQDLHFILYNQACEIEGVRFWGSPYTPEHSDKWTFTLPRSEMDLNWRQIPFTTDILITHGPPANTLDLHIDEHDSSHVGCHSLLRNVYRVKPRLHLFGHVHSSRGVQVGDTTTFINGSIKRDHDNSINPVWVIDYNFDNLRVYEDGSMLSGAPF